MEKRKTRILFADDEPAIRITLPAILQQEGFEVSVAATVAEALAYINRDTFDVLLADLNIGERGDGFTLIIDFCINNVILEVLCSPPEQLCPDLKGVPICWKIGAGERWPYSIPVVRSTKWDGASGAVPAPCCGGGMPGDVEASRLCEYATLPVAHPSWIESSRSS